MAEFSEHLTRLLISNPGEGIVDPEFVAMQRRNPGLRGLHPLARARALLHCAPGKLSKSVVKAALETCWISHDALIDIESEENFERTEQVEYSLGPCTFLATGQMLYCRIPLDKVRSMRLSMVPPKSIATADFLSPSTLAWLWRFEPRHRPLCCISDGGDMLGAMSHRLIAVGGLELEGPEISVGYTGEAEISEQTDAYSPTEVWDEDADCLRICWLHYLSEGQARDLGIAISRRVERDSESSPARRPYPDWIDSPWADMHGWILVDALEDAYRNGDEVLEKLSFLVGPDASWAPPVPEEEEEHDDDDDDDDHEDDDEERQDGEEREEGGSDLEPAYAPDALIGWEVEIDRGPLPRELIGLLFDLQCMIRIAGA